MSGDCPFSSIECLTSHRPVPRPINESSPQVRLNARQRTSSTTPRSSSGSHSVGLAWKHCLHGLCLWAMRRLFQTLPDGLRYESECLFEFYLLFDILSILCLNNLNYLPFLAQTTALQWPPCLLCKYVTLSTIVLKNFDKAMVKIT